MARTTPSEPAHGRISMDITEMGSGAVGQKYVLTVIDLFSRFINIYPMSARTAENVVNKLDMAIESYSVP